MRVLHAPTWTGTGTALETDATPDVLNSVCNSSEPTIDAKQKQVTCQSCITQLRKTSPQWLNRLHLLGWSFHVRIPKRQGRQADPRQMDFGDLFGTEQKLS